VTPEIVNLLAELEEAGYIAEPSTATALYLARATQKPLLVEGDAGVGKTELAKVLARLLGTELIRLQCYEGLDVQTALYEWDYPRQMLRLRIADGRGEDATALEARLFSREYLLERPLLRAITHAGAPAVLLIDEIDRADDGFEAFLLEILSDFQVTIPELGTIKAAPEAAPIVVITSNRTREIHDALKRRCLYHWVGYPSAVRELAIVRAKVPGISKALSEQVVHFVQALRKQDLFKSPGVAETLDWAAALAELDVVALDPATVSDTLGVLLKYQDDIARFEGTKVKEMLDEVRAELRAAE
jgi:MoxR-like ATPase